MSEFLKLIAAITNELHDILVSLSDALGIGVTDTMLHFLIIGLLGAAIFIATDVVFRRLARWNVSAISFVYTFTVLIVVVFGIEIQQKITGRGSMSFDDAVAGLWGFIWILAAYGILRLLVFLAHSLRDRDERQSVAAPHSRQG